MRTKKQIDEAIKSLFTDYQQKFGGEGFADNDIPQIIKRTISRKRVEHLDKGVDALNLTQEELDNWQKELDKENSDKAEALFHDYLAQGNKQMAEYQINNYRKVWSVEKRKELAKLIDPTFTVSPHCDLVMTEAQVAQETRTIERAEQKRLKKEQKKNGSTDQAS